MKFTTNSCWLSYAIAQSDENKKKSAETYVRSSNKNKNPLNVSPLAQGALLSTDCARVQAPVSLNVL